MHLLLIEDELATAELVVEGLRDAGYQVEHVDNGSVGLERALAGTANCAPWNLIIVDRTLPGLDGLSIVQALRQRNIATPILVLSALSDVDDRVTGLNAGGDDYLTKPYAFAELLARVEALLRRGTHGSAPTQLQIMDLVVDLLARTAKRGDRQIELTAREFDLLVFLMRNVNQIVTRKMLLEHVWGMLFDPQTNVVDVHMSRLRQVVDRGFEKPLIHTVRGMGYQLLG